jgi:hypothetical protein
VSKTISKIKGTCRNIQRPGGDVFGEFFLVFFVFSSPRAILYYSYSRNPTVSLFTKVWSPSLCFYNNDSKFE